MTKLTEQIESLAVKKTLLLHSCCAPCSSYVLEYLSKYFLIDVLYYNPNISDNAEYEFRLAEQKRLIGEMSYPHPVTLQKAEYNPKMFFAVCKGLENEPEGGRRCEECFKLRLTYTAHFAEKNEYDYFATTLTVSPLKNSDKINRIGEIVSRNLKTIYLPSDFKKLNGYKRSVTLSKKYNLYRQKYCGCIFSKHNE